MMNKRLKASLVTMQNRTNFCGEIVKVFRDTLKQTGGDYDYFQNRSRFGSCYYQCKLM